MKILLVTDVDNWAFAHKARAIQANLPQYDFTIKTYKNYKDTDTFAYNHIHFFSSNSAIHYPYSHVTASLTSNNYWLKTWERSQQLFPKLTAVSCVSRAIYEDLLKHKLNKNLYLCMNGVDEMKFQPTPHKAVSDIFRVLWVGVYKKTPLPNRDVDVKGYCLVDLLKKKLEHYPDVELTIHSNSHRTAIPHEKMVNLYNSHDLLLCLSFMEGTPNPVFEAAACALPILSTPVGCVPEFLQEGVSGFFLPAYTSFAEGEKMLDVCVEKILYLKNHRDIGIAMGQQGRAIIEKDWTWKARAQQWIPVFENHQRIIPQRRVSIRESRRIEPRTTTTPRGRNESRIIPRRRRRG